MSVQLNRDPAVAASSGPSPDCNASTAVDIERWRRIRELLELAASQPTGERMAWLAGVEADPAVRARVFELCEEDPVGAPAEAPEWTPAAISASMDALAGVVAAGARVGAWRLINRVGRGGMGEVWQAERVDGGFRQEAAIKLMRGFGEAERFEGERAILARLDHSNIARLLDGGTLADGQPWLAMEFVRGRDLITHADASRLSLRCRIELFLGVCAAVASAHRLPVVHRDLKPSNVMVTTDGQVKLLDFGIAKLLSGALAQQVCVTAAMPMTPAYAAPEQLRREPVSTQTDVYALGLLLHELLVGALPPERRATADGDVLVRILTQEPPLASGTLGRMERARLDGVAAARGNSAAGLRGALRGDLDAIMAKALRLRPEDRYLSVDALAADLNCWLAQRPVDARRGSWRYRAGCFAARHRLAVALACLLLLSLVAGIGTAVWQAGEVARERDLALLESQRASAALAFQREIFRRARPTQHRGRQPTASELLDLGEQMLSERSELEPGVRATLIEELSRSRASLGAYEAAHKQALEARAIFASLGDRQATLRLDIHLASLEERLGLGDEARMRIDRVLAAAADADLPPADLYAAWYQRGILLGNGGDIDGADRAITRAIELVGLSASPPATVVGMEVVRAGYLSGSGRAEEAIERLAATRARLQSLGAFDDAAQQQWLQGEGLALEQLGRWEAAREAIDARLELSRRIYGPRHPAVAADLRQLARLALRQYDPNRALALAEAALPLMREHYGDNHSDVASVHQLLALARLCTGDLSGARQDAQVAIELRTRLDGEAHPRTLGARGAMAMIDEAAGRLVDAQRAADSIRAQSGWMQLNGLTRARLEGIRLFHAESAVRSRCEALSGAHAQATDPSGSRLLALYLAACWRGVGAHPQAEALLAGLIPEQPGEFAGDPALVRLRAQALMW